jgi:hypothetical protein
MKKFKRKKKEIEINEEMKDENKKIETHKSLGK